MIVEVILALSLLPLFVTAVVGALVYYHDSFSFMAEKARAVAYAQEGLEAARNIRDEQFSNLTEGSYGLTIDQNNHWSFAGTSDVQGVFTRQIFINSLNPSLFQVEARVTWLYNGQQQGTVSLMTYESNWRNQ